MPTLQVSTSSVCSPDVRFCFIIFHSYWWNIFSSRRDAVLPLSRPLTLNDGYTAVSEIHVPEGTTVWVSIAGVNSCRDLWGKDAAEWRPERWLHGDMEDSSKFECLDRVDVGKTRLPGIYSGMYVLSAFQSALHLIFVIIWRLTFFGGGRSCMWVLAYLDFKCLSLTLDNSLADTGSRWQKWVGVLIRSHFCL